jgi:cbb3-type cytochrome oxidase subunit 3
MLKFIKHHLASIEGMDVLASFALVLFMVIFVYVAYYAFFSMEKSTADEIAALPFQDDEVKMKL